ncbi:aldolase [Telmatobacter sp. DSM 110680]|uniref:Aldolase n=1 Tax=Telmatobacter sp. DSM 110680 TaxID=3036704 RepID=A0AAU7DPX6_9BACT
MMTIEEIRVACARSEPVHLGDPALARFSMPLCETFYPLGFPLQIETNSEEVLNCAAASWQGFVKLFDTQPLRLRIGVRTAASSDCPPAPVCKIQQHLATNIADPDNFSVIDLSKGFASIWLTQAAVAHRSYLRYFFLESAAMCLLGTSHTTAVHAACVEYKGCGILLCGDSGAGKSSLSYACARAGWTYITDDASFLVNSRNDRLVVGNCNQARFRPSAVELFSELTGKEIIQRAQVGKPSIEFNTQTLRDVSVSFTSHINHVVFINRRNVRRQELVEFPHEVAKYSMLQVLFSLPDTMLVQIAMIERLLDCGPLELRYHDFTWAVERLEHLAERGF